MHFSFQISSIRSLIYGFPHIHAVVWVLNLIQHRDRIDSHFFWFDIISLWLPAWYIIHYHSQILISDTLSSTSLIVIFLHLLPKMMNLLSFRFSGPLLKLKFEFFFRVAQKCQVFAMSLRSASLAGEALIRVHLTQPLSFWILLRWCLSHSDRWSWSWGGGEGEEEIEAKTVAVFTSLSPATCAIFSFHRSCLEASFPLWSVFSYLELWALLSGSTPCLTGLTLVSDGLSTAPRGAYSSVSCNNSLWALNTL